MSEGEVHLPHQSHASITAACAVQYPPPSLMENWFVYVVMCEERSGKKCWYLKGWISGRVSEVPSFRSRSERVLVG